MNSENKLWRRLSLYRGGFVGMTTEGGQAFWKGAKAVPVNPTPCRGVHPTPHTGSRGHQAVESFHFTYMHGKLRHALPWGPVWES